MNRSECFKILTELVNEYISNEHLAKETNDRIKYKIENDDFPPVRGVVEIIYRNKNKEINKIDKEKIDDMMHYYG